LCVCVLELGVFGETLNYSDTGPWYSMAFLLITVLTRCLDPSAHQRCYRWCSRVRNDTKLTQTWRYWKWRGRYWTAV